MAPGWCFLAGVYRWIEEDPCGATSKDRSCLTKCPSVLLAVRPCGAFLLVHVGAGGGFLLAGGGERPSRAGSELLRHANRAPLSSELQNFRWADETSTNSMVEEKRKT